MADLINNDQGVIYVRDIIKRYKKLEKAEPTDTDEERKTLQVLLNRLEGLGGEEFWRDSYYPTVLVRDSYFKQHTQEVTGIPEDARWPFNCIDWDKAAQELKFDYGQVDFNGISYWYQ